MVHIRCGDDIRDDLRRAGIPGTFKRWIDPSLDGPIPDVSGADEVVLWFEHDLFDQAILIRLLAAFCEQDLSKTRLSLVSRDSYPGIERFIGFGNLNSSQIADCYASREPVTQAQLDLGRRTWTAYNSEDPTALELHLKEDTSALPYLAAAMRKHLQELPATTNGLSRTEQIVLESAAAGHRSRSAMFVDYQRREETPWLGDTQFFDRLDRLASGETPLLHEGELTQAGRSVLANEADWIRIAGLEAPWRWDPTAQRVVRSSQ